MSLLTSSNTLFHAQEPAYLDKCHWLSILFIQCQNECEATNHSVSSTQSSTSSIFDIIVCWRKCHMKEICILPQKIALFMEGVISKIDFMNRFEKQEWESGVASLKYIIHNLKQSYFEATRDLLSHIQRATKSP